MTKEELNRRRMMFQINAKRNELLKPEDIGTSTVRHSATNDFLAFRKKVAAGMKKQKEQNAEVFNVTAANLQNYQDMLDSNELIHAGTGEFKPTYYQKVENAFGPGKHRYFYTKEEWDAYQNELAGYRKKADEYVKNRDASNNAGADRGAKDSTVATAQKYKKESEQNNQRRESLQNAQSSREAAMRSGQQATQKMTEQRQQALNDAQSGREAAIKNSAPMTAQKKGASDAVKELGDKVKDKVKYAVRKEAAKAEVESIRSDTARWNKYDRSVIDQVQSKYSDLDTFDKFMERAEKEGGVDKFYDKLEKEMRTLQNNVDSSNKPGADRAAKEAPADNKSSEKNSNTGDTAAERQKKIIDDAFKEGANADDLASKYGVSTEYIRELVYNVSGKTVPTKREIESKNSNNSGTNKTGTVSKEFQQEMESNSKKNTYELKSGPSNNSSSGSSGYYFTVENGKTVKKAKHDGLEGGITTDAMTPEQEYIAFRKKVEAGMKHFGLNRNLMSVPKNQALADGDSMSHAGYKPAGTHEYVAKIDNAFGPGKHRYFYTKEEWDGYQKNAGYAQNAEKKKSENTFLNNNPNYKKNMDYAQNAEKKRAYNEKINNDSYYQNNKKYSEQQKEAESKRWQQEKIKNNPQLLNVNGEYIEPVKNIYAELNSSSKDRSRIYQTYVVDFSWNLRDRDYEKGNEEKFARLKQYAFDEIDKMYNKKDAELMKKLINDLEDDQRNIVKYMKDASDDDYYKKKLKTDNMHKIIADAINRKMVDDKTFRTEAEAVKYAINKIEDAMYHVWYDFMESDSKAKDFYKRYEYNIIGKNDELGFRKQLLKRMRNEIEKEVIESFPKEVAKKYLPKDFWN